jgi:hypothetical protein
MLLPIRNSQGLRANNARWLKLAARQLLLEVDDLG